jgi:hypothetical protein
MSMCAENKLLLERNGYVVIPNALNIGEVVAARDSFFSWLEKNPTVKDQLPYFILRYSRDSEVLGGRAPMVCLVHSHSTC